jgi:hypothetical protein
MDFPSFNYARHIDAGDEHVFEILRKSTTTFFGTDVQRSGCVVRHPQSDDSHYLRFHHVIRFGSRADQALQERYGQEPKRSEHGEISACVFSLSVLY